jgi:RNA polymerase sigma-70 factor (ECF subfamily)
MQDQQIIDLYFARNEQAIAETDKKYGADCMRVSYNILNSRQDAEECVNDTYLHTWRSIPPHRPDSLRAFLCRIVRNLSLNRLREMRAAKRSRELTVSLEELEDCIAVDLHHADQLANLLSDFMEAQDELDRKLFMGRYWHAVPVKTLAEEYGMTPNAVTLRLKRTRERLRAFLEEGGYSV